MKTLIVAWVMLLSWTQEVPNPGEAQGPPQGSEESGRATANRLKSRIHEVRRALLGGGEMAQRAESEALEFYRKKMRELEGSRDSTEGELLAAKVEYMAKLDLMLGTDASSSRMAALGAEARRVKSEIETLEGRRDALTRRLAEVGNGIRSLERKTERRKFVLEQLDSGMMSEEVEFMVPAMGEETRVAEAPEDGPLSRDVLRDLAERNPSRARAIVFAQDPGLYWRFWPLQPPLEVIKAAIAFPQQDPPGNR